MANIWYQEGNREPEKIESDVAKADTSYLVHEYRVAFGSYYRDGIAVWAGLKRDAPREWSGSNGN